MIGRFAAVILLGFGLATSVRGEDKAFLGVCVGDLSGSPAGRQIVSSLRTLAYPPLPTRAAILVGDVCGGGPAEQAGLDFPDLIIRIDGKPVKGPDAYNEIMDSLHPGRASRSNTTAPCHFPRKPRTRSNSGSGKSRRPCSWPTSSTQPRRRFRHAPCGSVWPCCRGMSSANGFSM